MLLLIPHNYAWGLLPFARGACGSSESRAPERRFPLVLGWVSYSLSFAVFNLAFAIFKLAFADLFLARASFRSPRGRFYLPRRSFKIVT